VLGTGYNGLPKGITLPDGTPRDIKRSYMIHAEQNACSACSGSPLIAVTTHSPCQSCLSLLVSRGVLEIYFITKYWRETSSDQAKLFGIKMEQLFLRKELFDEFTKLTACLVSAQLTNGD
jgi:deoxycytidylate deaminase